MTQDTRHAPLDRIVKYSKWKTDPLFKEAAIELDALRESHNELLGKLRQSLFVLTNVSDSSYQDIIDMQITDIADTLGALAKSEAK